MCIFCAALPVTAAVGVKLNADQLHKEEVQRLLVPHLVAILIGFLVVASAVYHTLRWQD